MNGKSGIRLRGLIRKEFLQIRRDPSSIAIAFLMPVFLLLIFGYGISLDAEHVPIALVVEQADADTAGLVARFEGSRYFSPILLRDPGLAEETLMERRVSAIVRLRQCVALKATARFMKELFRHSQIMGGASNMDMTEVSGEVRKKALHILALPIPRD